jgi:opacity protein-like surface antigen
MKRFLFATSALALVGLAQGASAQQFYAGIGYQTIQDDWGDVNWPESSGAALIAGYQSPFGAGNFWAAEIDTNTSDDSTLQDRTLRLRGLVGRNFGTVEGFVSLGFASATGTLPDFVNGEGSNLSGMTYGIGAQIPVSERFKLRLEALQDRYDTFDGKTWESTSIRAAALFSF